jgi:hypothetical protein
MTGNGELKPSADFAVTRDELMQVCEETEAILQGLKDTINIHAEVLGLHRFILDKFVPKPLLAQAAKEYYDQRTAQINAEENASPPKNAN